MKPLDTTYSLYIHIPWCIKKCPYCDFNSHEKRDDYDEQAYVNALIRDLNEEAPRLAGRQLSSIFIGGGTPSLFSAESIDQVLKAVHQQLNIADDIEITLEANPGTAEADKFSAFRHI
ncbi:YggW family oxidoreductase, partial [Cycloclasticus sp. 46_83_sub15_T18]